MNSYQRIMATLNRQPVDRLAYMPITMMFAADILQIPYGEYVTDYRKLVEGQLQTAKELRGDHVSVISDPAREAADYGATIIYGENQPPAIDENNALLADKSRLNSLPALDPVKPGSRCHDRVAAVALFREKVKGELLIEGWVEGPCAEASDLRGINHLMLDLVDDPVFVHQLFEKCAEGAIRFAQAQVDAGADLIGVGDAAASLVGPRAYRELVLPYEKQIVDAIHQMGAKVRLHICGNTSKSLADIGQLGCDIIDLDSMVSLADAREKMGLNQTLAGNVDPVRIIRNGTPDSIIEALQACYAQAGTNYIVGAGCEIPRDTSMQNLQAVIKFIDSIQR